MITFSPIHKNVQETLTKKMIMLDRNISSYSIGTTRATEDGNTNENYMFARSVFLRMTSLLTYNKKPVIIMGGEMREGKFKSGYDDLYGKRSTTDENKMRRPIAGIKDVNVEYKGGGMKIGATRTTTVNWTCWTWEELQRFKPFFLKHGRSVLIEFGWSFSGIDKPTMLDVIDDNGELKEELIKNAKTGRSLSEILPEHILKQKGHYDAILGIIQNFEFSVNESGGFDCTTDIISLGVNTLQKMDSKENMMGSVGKLPINNPTKSKWWRSPDNFMSEIADKNPYYNFIAYMKSLQGHLHKNAEASKGSIAYLTTDFEPYCTWGWFEDNVLSRFVSIVNKQNEVVTEFRSIENVYDDAGNLVSIQPIKIRNSKDMLTVDFNKWALLNNEDGMLLDGFTNLANGKTFDLKFEYGAGFGGKDVYEDQFIEHFGPIPEEADDKSFRVFTVIKEPNNATIDEEQYGVSDEGTGRSYLIIEDEQKEAKKKSGARQFNQKEGVLRNVYFHWKFLMDSFVDASTIKDGILKVWDTFSGEYGGIYDFAIDFDDKEGRLLIRDKGFAEKQVDKVLENTSQKPAGEEYDNKGVFVFPIWEKNSMVKSQTLSAKLPSRMQVAAMYGSNAPGPDDGVVDNYDDWGALALGKAEKKSEKETLHIFEEGAEQQKLYDSLIGSMEHPFRRGVPPQGDTGPPGEEYTFGNASANITKKLRWVEGGGASTNTTGIYEDFTGEDADSGYDNMVLGINEVLNEQLTEEFQNRLKKAIGVNEKGELPDDVDEDALTPEGIGLMEANWRKKDDSDQESGFWNIIYTEPSHQTQGKLNKPKMKSEYAGMMRTSLKDPGGLLKQTDPIVPIELEVEIDGLGGIFPGNSFHSSYLPQSYLERMCFQIKGVSQKVDATGWTTTLQGQMRVAAQKKKSLQMIEAGEGFDPNTKLEITGKDLPDAPAGMFWGTDANGKSILKPIPADLIADPNLRVEAQGSIEEGDTPEEILEMTKLKTKEVAVEVYGASDAGQTDRDQLLNQAVGVKPAFEVFGDGLHFDKDDLRTLVEGIDADMEFEGTGNQFLRYMSGNVMNEGLFPTSWDTSSAEELENAYNIWRANYQYATPLIGNMSVPEWLNVEGNGRWQTGGAGQGG